MTIVAVMLALMLQANDVEVRKEFVACLNTAGADALKEKVPIDGFEAYAHQKCASVEQRFKSDLVKTAIKHGMSRTAAGEDADLQIGDYLFTAKDQYADKVTHESK